LILELIKFEFCNIFISYRPGFKANFEVKRGLVECLTRMKDEDEQTLIDVQIDSKNELNIWFSLGY